MQHRISPTIAISLVALFFSLTGTALAADWTLAPPTIKQAEHAIHNSDYRNEHVGPCKHVGMNVSCVVTSFGCYDDNVFGRSTDEATTIVGVGPRIHVWTIVPTRTDIYPGCPEGAVVGA